VLESSGSGILRAYDAANLANELYNSNQNRTRDALGSYVKFSTPTIANGKVYAGTRNSLTVYGLLDPRGAGFQPAMPAFLRAFLVPQAFLPVFLPQPATRNPKSEIE
jgi:hypothetical protein